jgi:hypothetical protein
MKKLLAITALVISILIHFSFTHIDNPKIYSCDPVINKWAHDNADTNQKLTRNELVRLDFRYQVAAFRSLTPNNKLRIYHEKIDQLLTNSSLNEKDKTHLRNLSDFIKSDFYSSPKPAKYSQYLENWKSKAYNDLGWSAEKMFLLVETWMTEIEIKNLTKKKVDEPKKDNLNSATDDEAIPPPTCYCNSHTYCGFQGYEACSAFSGCTASESGCGFFGGSPCYGVCR